MSTFFNGIKRLFGIETPPESPALYLNLGCGSDYREGYINVDMRKEHKVDILSDAVSLPTIADASCAQVLAQDVLVHIARHRSLTALREWNRVLQPGGMLVLRLPSLTHVLKLLESPEWQSYERQKLLIERLYGTQGHEGDFHRNGYTEATLRHELVEAGFTITSLDVVDAWMFEVIAVKHRHMRPEPLLSEPDDAVFIDQAYMRILGSEPDEKALQYYLDALERGVDRETVLASLEQYTHSEEYQQALQARQANTAP